MSLKNDAFPSSAAFDVINSTLSADENERKDVIKQANSIVGITLKNEQGQEESWYIDLKEKGVAGKGAAPAGKKAEVTLTLSDKDFASLLTGTANAQRLFMGGKLKIKGNIMKATKIEPVLKKTQGRAKL